MWCGAGRMGGDTENPNYGDLDNCPTHLGLVAIEAPSHSVELSLFGVEWGCLLRMVFSEVVSYWLCLHRALPNVICMSLASISFK